MNMNIECWARLLCCFICCCLCLVHPENCSFLSRDVTHYLFNVHYAAGHVLVKSLWNQLLAQVHFDQPFSLSFSFTSLCSRFLVISIKSIITHISYHIISYHIISYHIISYHIISYHIISYLIMNFRLITRKD
jgi:hypothetical protein